MSQAARLEMEGALKGGTLPALVATSSLELGIDVGEIDLVVHLQSPKSVGSGLQRVGRSGHLVGQTSVGRIFTTLAEDVMEAAAVAHGMLRGEIEATHTPENPLDVLAQQYLADVGAEDWDLDDLLRAGARRLPVPQPEPRPTFRGVVEMLAGKYPEQVSRYLQARLSWDRVNNRLAALPGIAHPGHRQRRARSRTGAPTGWSCRTGAPGRRAGRGVRLRDRASATPSCSARRSGGRLEITDDRVVAEPAPGEIAAHALLARRRPLAPVRPGPAHRGSSAAGWSTPAGPGSARPTGSAG